MQSGRATSSPQTATASILGGQPTNRGEPIVFRWILAKVLLSRKLNHIKHFGF
jgi:hypothetical protein